MKRIYWIAGIAGTLALIQTAGAITFGRTSGTTATTTSVTTMTTVSRTGTSGGFGTTTTSSGGTVSTGTLSPIATSGTTYHTSLGLGGRYLPSRIISNPGTSGVTNIVGKTGSGGSKHVPDASATGTLLSLGVLSVAWLKRKLAA